MVPRGGCWPTKLSTWSYSRFPRGLTRAHPRGVTRAPIMIPVVRTDRFPVAGRPSAGITHRPVTWTKSRPPTAPDLPIKSMAPIPRIGPNASWQIRYFTPAARGFAHLGHAAAVRMAASQALQHQLLAKHPRSRPVRRPLSGLCRLQAGCFWGGTASARSGAGWRPLKRHAWTRAASTSWVVAGLGQDRRRGSPAPKKTAISR